MPSNSNWCPEIYRSVFVDRHNDSHVRVAPCCQAKTRLETVEDFDFYTSPYLQDLRQRFDRGERPPECSRCWKDEDVGHKSRRQSAAEFFNLDNESRKIILESIDHSATWACNLACIMCGTQSSSRWATELSVDKTRLQQMGRLFQKQNNFLDRLDLAHIKKVHFNGGEPMLNDDQIALLEQLEQQGSLSEVFVSYNTNGTKMPSDRITQLWSRTRLIKLFFSIDATGAAFDYIRYPGHWDDVTKNLLDMKQHLPSNVVFGLNVTVGAYNVLDLRDLYEWFQENISCNREGDLSNFCWQFAYNYDPAWLRPDAKKQAAIELSGIEAFQGIVSYLENHINYIAQDNWTKQLDDIDLRRGTNWRESLNVGKYY